jgi:hypothetical protein
MTGDRGTRYPVKVAARARELRTLGWSSGRIQRILEQEFGVRPSRQSVLRWADDEYADRVRQQVRAGNLQRWSTMWTFELGGSRPSDEYQEAFIRRLRDQGVPYSSIAKVCNVVFAGRWTEDRVRWLFGVKNNRARKAAA